MQDKTASAELAIDGHLVEKKQKPISQQEILEELKRKGLPIAKTIAETDIFDSWQSLRLEQLVPDTHSFRLSLASKQLDTLPVGQLSLFEISERLCA